MRYRIEAITNSDGEFTFPNMKPENITSTEAWIIA